MVKKGKGEQEREVVLKLCKHISLPQHSQPISPVLRYPVEKFLPPLKFYYFEGEKTQMDNIATFLYLAGLSALVFPLTVKRRRGGGQVASRG